MTTATPTPPTDRRCPVCWSPFTPTAHNPQQRFCRPACRVEQWRRDRDAEHATPGPAPAGNVSNPCRDDRATTTTTPPERCPVCQATFQRIGRQRFCSDTCRKTAWRRRHSTAQPNPVVVPVGRSQRDVTIYACPDCQTRYLAQQWCFDCNQPCRRIGLGGPCPHCEEPVAVTDLFDTDTPTETRPQTAP